MPLQNLRLSPLRLFASTLSRAPKVEDDYFVAFEGVRPPKATRFQGIRVAIWQGAAGLTIGLGCWYLMWRWGASLNPDAPMFSTLVAAAETMMFLGTLLFFFDIWREADTPQSPPADVRGGGTVDIFITTYNESTRIVAPSVQAAKAVKVPDGWQARVFVLDDGKRSDMQNLARQQGVEYIARDTNRGFKAGNLKNALLRTEGDFIVICDADTRLFPRFLENTLGYFADAEVAWVQTPHWFYDIPQSRHWRHVLPQGLRGLAGPLRWLTGQAGPGGDPFMNGSTMFFDVIQRRRNRHGASFCCGAASIHRRAAIFDHALRDHATDRSAATRSHAQRWLAPATTALQPFRFHVSEDIFTSIQMHSAGQKSVYHPHVEARMLSPWSMDAWAAQKLKYAGGTLDIIWRGNPVFKRGMPWHIKLHYAATFWSYLCAPVLLLLLLAPVWALFSGTAPVEAYSLVFFAHLLPFLIANEIALAAGCNGADGTQGRILSVATLPITLRAMAQTLMGRRVRFRPTPKTPIFSGAIRFVLPQIGLLLLMVAAAIYGVWAHHAGSSAHTPSLLVVNFAWMAWNATALAAPVMAALWRPVSPSTELRGTSHVAGPAAGHEQTPRHANPNPA